MLYKTYMALNHYKLTLVCKHFAALRNAPRKTRAAEQLVETLHTIALWKPFKQMLAVCATRNLRVREWH